MYWKRAQPCSLVVAAGGEEGPVTVTAMPSMPTPLRLLTCTASEPREDE